MKKGLLALGVALCFLFGLAQEKRPARYYRVTGPRDGVSFFPLIDYPQTRPRQPGVLDFQHYHTYEEVLFFLQQWQKEHPDLVDLYAVDKSFEGRDIWQLTLTNKKTGTDTDKPAMFLEGNRHSGEVTGAEAALYFAWQLLANHGKDPEITNLLDRFAYYVRVKNNPDGSELYLHTALSNRSTVRPHDDDGDGLLDEDPAEDLDGDGFIMQLRQKVGKGKGDFIINPEDKSRRLMKRVGEGKGDYRMYSEGVDNDGDGRFNEDGIGGLDLHRNYPENWRPEPGLDLTRRGWTQMGAGAYPLSESETRSVVLFLLQHPNVAVGQTLDTTVPMLLRPPSTSRSEESMCADDLAIYRRFDQEGQKLTSYPYAGDVYWDYANIGRGYYRNEGESAEPHGFPLFGHSPDFGYFYYGAVWYGDELWCGGRVKDYNGDGKVDELEMLRWNDEALAGKGFKNWTKFNHPQLGEVEIGGFNPKFFSQNPPPEFLEEWVARETRFNMLLAKSLPHLAILSAEAKLADEKNKIYEITLTATNDGLLPTALEMAKRIKIVQPDRALISFADQAASLVEGKKEIEWGFFKPGEKKEAHWKVKAVGTKPEVEISLLSTRGGVQKKKITLE